MRGHLSLRTVGCGFQAMTLDLEAMCMITLWGNMHLLFQPWQKFGIWAWSQVRAWVKIICANQQLDPFDLEFSLNILLYISYIFLPLTSVFIISSMIITWNIVERSRVFKVLPFPIYCLAQSKGYFGKFDHLDSIVNRSFLVEKDQTKGSNNSMTTAQLKAGTSDLARSSE